MTQFRLRLTKTQTTISTYETTVDLPTDDATKAAAYGEVAGSFGPYSSRTSLHPLWREGETKIEVVCTAQHEMVPREHFEVPRPPAPPEAAQ